MNCFTGYANLLALAMALSTAIAAAEGPVETAKDAAAPATVKMHLPTLATDNPALDRAFRIALGDLAGNVAPLKDGLLEAPVPVVLAGLDYDTPWTRDAAINAWNGASLVMPAVARDTLLSVLTRADGKVRIGGQYWDAMVWTTGAWNHYLYTGDREFLSLALGATRNSLAYFEETEFDAQTGLFRGPGWSDGVAAYPDEYATTTGAILDWPQQHPDHVVRPGYGIPMEAISTNCLYYNAYVTAQRMAGELGVPADPQLAQRAAALRQAINRHLWNADRGSYRFFVGPFGPCDHQEALGQAYAILFGVADPAQTGAIFAHQHVTPAGVPCVWPTLGRYEGPDGKSFGRHSGTVWPQIQGFWADAAARHGKTELFGHELFQLAEHACRDRHFAEIYHPLSGMPYGGMQEAGRGIILWQATSRQTWAATAYLRMVLLDLVGLRFEPDGVRFQPCVPKGVTRIKLGNLAYRKMNLDITVQGQGPQCQRVLVNGQALTSRLLSSGDSGDKQIEITVGE